jgi:hypothetical protein
MVIAAIVYISSVGRRNAGFQTARDALGGATSLDSDGVVLVIDVAVAVALLRRARFRSLMLIVGAGSWETKEYEY